MIKKGIVLAGAVAAAAISSAAAHPGSKLLTTGAGARAAMTEGMSYQDVNGVHLFKGTPSLAGAQTPMAGGRPMSQTKIVVVHRYPWRSFRQLRTQGFYSGPGAISRRYTQGFYSGD